MQLHLLIMSSPILQVKHLSIDFQTEDATVHAVSDISFSVAAGRSVAIVGESGSGKSVTALSILRLIPSPPSIIRQGSIVLSLPDLPEIDLVQATDAELRRIRGSRIGMIFQEPMSSLNPLMRCGLQVAEVLRQHLNLTAEAAKKQTIELFHEVQLPDPESMFMRYPHEISGGQKQRVMIAMAICCNPALLIADEPTTALDVTVQRSILQLLTTLQQRRGMAILFITHDLELVKRFADDVVILYRSKLIEQGTAAEVFHQPKERYTLGLLHCRPKEDIRVKYLQTIEQYLDQPTTLPPASNTISNEAFSTRIASLAEKPAILELKDIHIRYTTKSNLFGKSTQWYNAVNGVSMQIPEGATLGLVGESGCGKTSIGKAIAGLTEVYAGSILYKGESIDPFHRTHRNFRREIQLIFQDPYGSLNPTISIQDAIREPMDVHGLYDASLRSARVVDLLDKVGLPSAYARRFPHELSGGQRQRVCIARALALNPSLIICDESVSALDVSVQAQVLNVLVDLRDEFKLTYLFISHDMEVVRHFSDYVAVMQNGKICELQDAESVYQKPVHPYTKMLLQHEGDKSMNL
jgi:peptide/nickel transport system ATP-binding protein